MFKIGENGFKKYMFGWIVFRRGIGRAERSVV
jgi:hypothetical protein